MLILTGSCGHGDPLDFVLFMIFVIVLYDSGSRSKMVCGVSNFFIQVGNWNVSLELSCLRTFLKYISHVSFSKFGLTSSFFFECLCVLVPKSCWLSFHHD